MTLLPPQPPASTGNDTFDQQLQELPAFRALLRAVEARFYTDLPLPSPVLDLGCGDGHFASVAFGQPLDVGLDPWWGPLQAAQRRGSYHQLTFASGARMPFATASFASVVSNSVLEHIPTVQPVLHEVARVLQSGGRFYFCVPGPDFRRFLSVARILDAVHLRGAAEAYRRLFDRITRHYYYNDPATWEKRLAETGLHLTRWWPYFSPGATAALEWGHPLGLPSVLAYWLTRRWLLVPTRWNLRLTAWLLRRYYAEPPATQGAFLFFCPQK